MGAKGTDHIHVEAQMPDPPPGERLESWKEIASYLKRDVRTVQRWEKREALPVHRHIHDKLGSVYAYTAELDAWRTNRAQPATQINGAPGIWRRPLVWIAGIAFLLAAFAGLAWRLSRNASRPSETGELTTRRLWAGPDADRFGGISPDGRYFAFSDSANQDLAVRDLVTGEQRRLINRPPGEALTPIFSPDGRQIAYAWFNNEERLYELRVIGADGSNPRLLYQSQEVAKLRPADWSRDGRFLLVALNRRDLRRQLVLVSVSDGAVRILKDLDSRGPLALNFSPDGRYIVYDLPHEAGAAEHDLFALERDSGREAALVRHPANDFLLGWVPNSQTILFASDRTGTVDAWALDVVSGQAQGAPRLIHRDVGWIWPLGFTRRGSFYYGLQTGMTEVYVTRIDPASGAVLAPPAPVPQRLVGANRSPDWSPDGRFVAFAFQRLPSYRWPFARIMVRRVEDGPESGQEKELRPPLLFVDLLRWSRDGRSFLVVGYDRESRHGLFKVDAQTAETVPVMLGSEPRYYFHEPLWVSADKKVFYKLRDWATEPARLMLRDLETGREKQFLPSVYRFALSRDGQQVAFSNFDSQQETISLVPVLGGEPRLIHRQKRGTGRIRSLAWTATGEYVLFARRGNLWRIPAAGGEPQKLLEGMEDLRDLRVHPDGQRIAFTAGAGKGELWVMENALPQPGRQ